MGYLYVHENSITGTIPPTFIKMSSLHTLRLDRNDLTGSVTDEFYDMASLFNVQLKEGNEFSGGIPDVYFVEESKLHYSAD